MDSSQGDATRRWLALLPRPSKSGLDQFAQIRRLVLEGLKPMSNPEHVDFIQQDQPDVVVRAIEAAIRAAREEERLPACREVFHRVTAVRCL